MNTDYNTNKHLYIWDHRKINLHLQIQGSQSRIMDNDENTTISNSTEVEDQQHLHELEISLDIELEMLERKKKERDEIMKALHHYNEIKDATQEVLGRLAIIEGVTVAEIHRRYDLLESD